MPAALSCSHCKLPMQPVGLAGHYGQSVEVDLCSPCHLVWFDSLESVRLSGLGWLQMLRAMEAAHRSEHRQLGGSIGCARCGAELKTVHNRTAFGRSTARECPKGHGQFQSFNLLLAERGLIRPLLPADLAAARRAGKRLFCVNCGGDLHSAGDTECSWCGSAVALLDVARLVRALAPGLQLAREDGTDDGPARRVAWPCSGCGVPLDPTVHDACPACSHAVLAPSLSDVLPLLDELEPQLDALRGALRADEAKPLSQALLRQRLDALERSRTTAAWQDPPTGAGGGDDGTDGPDWSSRWTPILVGAGLLLWWLVRRR